MRYLTLLLLFLTATLLPAQSSYELYATTNKVLVKPRGTTNWLVPQKGMSLSILDSVCLYDHSEIKIKSLATNELYRSSHPGAYRVKDIRDAARQQAANLSAITYQQALQRQPNAASLGVVGATERGLETSSCDQLANAILAIGKAIEQGTYVFDNTFTFSTSQTANELTFTLSNRSDSSYCVNVVKYDFQAHTASLCYVISPTVSDTPYLLMAAGQTLSFDTWLFALPAAHQQYILIATPQAYDTEHLQSTLSRLTWDDIEQGTLLPHLLTSSPPHLIASSPHHLIP